MPFSSSEIVARVGLLRQDPDERVRALGDNFHMECRLSGARCRDYEDLAQPHSSLLDAQKLYYKQYLKVDMAEAAAPFTPANDLATVTVKRERTLVRVENLSGPIRDTGLDAGTFVWNVTASGEGHAVAQEGLDNFFKAWNRDRSGAPAFAAFKDQVGEDVDAADWHLRLRSALGLGHLSISEQGNQPFLIGLFEITAGEVLDSLPEAERPYAFAAPTAVDAFFPYFFPSPRPADGSGVDYGCTVTLDRTDERLVNEVLHRPIPYKREHLKKVAWISDIPGDAPLWDIRNAHLRKLLTVRPDFVGVEMQANDRVA